MTYEEFIDLKEQLIRDIVDRGLSGVFYQEFVAMLGLPSTAARQMLNAPTWDAAYEPYEAHIEQLDADALWARYCLTKGPKP